MCKYTAWLNSTKNTNINNELYFINTAPPVSVQRIIIRYTLKSQPGDLVKSLEASTFKHRDSSIAALLAQNSNSHSKSSTRQALTAM
jgi:hypothetical protein